ncbi:MAG: hypothetical protein KAV87_57760 [Desulfobacteraceae bacterium]|nr:hypothetical protein [Desulfobacteraceae bacterium]
MGFIIGLSCYLAGMLLIGYFMSKRIHTAEDYLVAGRNLGYVLHTATMTSCFIGGAMLIALPGISYSLGLWSDKFLWGINAIWGGFLLCLLLLGTFVMPNLWRLKQLSIGDFYYSRFSRLAGITATIIDTGAFVFWVAVQVIVFAKIISPLTGISMGVAIIVALVVVCTYTLLGGLWAVGVTDIFQVSIVIIGVIILFPVSLIKVGGWGAVTGSVPLDMMKFFPQESSFNVWLAWIGVWLLVGFGGLAAPDVTQRAYAAKSPKVARYSAYITILIAGGFGVLTILLGYIGFTFVKNGGMPTEMLKMLADDPELIVPLLFKTILPGPLVVLFLGAGVCAIMSAADSALLALSGMISKNIYMDIFRPDCSPKRLLLVSRLVVVCVTIVAGAIALYFPYAGLLVAFAFDLMMACLLAPLILGIFWKKTNSYGAVAGMFIGLVFRVIVSGLIEGFNFEGITYPAHWYYFAVFSPVLSTIAVVLVSSLTQRKNPPKPLMSTEGQIVESSLRV